jgi:outer membrane autotransporter protein
MFNATGGIEKMRYTLGVDYKWRKQHVFGLSYKYQNVRDDEDSNRHILGISYKYKF